LLIFVSTKIKLNNQKSNAMKRNEILNLFKSLAKSQGHYGRLLRTINENKEWGDEYLEYLERKNFKSEIDLILEIEGC